MINVQDGVKDYACYVGNYHTSCQGYACYVKKYTCYVKNINIYVHGKIKDYAWVCHDQLQECRLSYKIKNNTKDLYISPHKQTMINEQGGDRFYTPSK